MSNVKNEKRLKNRILVLIGSLLGPPLLRFLYNTNKTEIINDNYYEDALKSGKSVIIASWHSTLLTTFCLLYTSPSPRDDELSRMPSSA